MKKIVFKDIKELADIMHYDAHSGAFVVSVLFYDEAIELMKKLMCYDDVIPEGFEIVPEIWNGYGNEYYIQLDEDMRLSIEKVWHDGIVYRCEADYFYIDDKSDEKIKEANDGLYVDISFNDCLKFDKYSITKSDEDKLDKILSTAEIKRDKDGNEVLYKLDLNLVLDYLFGDD